MSRPQSAASSVGGGHAASAAGHKRAASSKANIALRPNGPSVVSLFLTNLRLLNLDLLHDWPAPTSATFGNQDAKARIKTSEWALFQLFRKYDAVLTADKLQPFFPPLEPLQSINLRAALYRCLDTLKKNGALGRETVLRKTMLDECSGDKFFELCLSFSAVVLRKITLDRKHTGHHRRMSSIPRPIAQHLGSAPSLKKAEWESLLPLAIAHKAALSKVLKEKERKRMSYCRLHDILSEKEDELKLRRAEARERAERSKTMEEVNKLEAVEKIVQKTWVGSSSLRDSVLMGDEMTAHDGVLHQSYDDVWIDNELNHRGQPSASEQGTLESLHSRAQEQNDRLRKWQKWHDELKESIATRSPSNVPTSQTEASPVRFDQHRNLSIRSNDQPDNSDAREQQTLPPSSSVASYDEILTVMREELKRSTMASKRFSQAPPSISQSRESRPDRPKRQVSVAFALDNATAGAERPSGGLQRTSSVSPRPPSHPLRPGIVRRASSRSKGYTQPRIERQTAPIPLKSEIFSPLKRQSGFSPASRDSASPNGSIEENGDYDVRRSSQSNDRTSTSHASGDSGVGLGMNLPLMSGMQRTVSDDFTPEREAADSPVETVVISPEERPKSEVDLSVRRSLAERTRRSMAFSSSEDINGFLPEPSVSERNHTTEEQNSGSSYSAHQMLDRRTSLLERTRQSISLFPQLPINPTSPRKRSIGSRHSRSRSSIYPVNQFETPQKKRRSSVGTNWLDGIDEVERSPSGTNGAVGNGSVAKRRNFTPREKLFEVGAEYDSVFKSRPRVAQSPLGDSSLVDGDGDESGFVGMEEVGAGSPLLGAGVGVGVGGR